MPVVHVRGPQLYLFVIRLVSRDRVRIIFHRSEHRNARKLCAKSHAPRARKEINSDKPFSVECSTHLRAIIAGCQYARKPAPTKELTVAGMAASGRLRQVTSGKKRPADVKAVAAGIIFPMAAPWFTRYMNA